MNEIKINTSFNVYTDARGGDPDSTSRTLRQFHKLLWSKPLPSGQIFKLSESQNSKYLHHKSELGEFFLGSDAITHSYRNHKRKEWLTNQISNEVNELFDTGSTLGAYTIFPNNRIDKKHTINQARGINSLIDDRFDLTLECIRLFYLDLKSPLYETLARYKDFFELFESFDQYIQFFLLQDLIDENNRIKFYLPFDNFNSKPIFSNLEQYLVYKKGVMSFIQLRNNRIANYSKQNNL
jgi:hypothetical protein